MITFYEISNKLLILGVVAIKKISEYATIFAPIILIVLMGANLIYLVHIGYNYQKEYKAIDKELITLSTRLNNFEEVLKEDKKTVLLKQDEEMIEFVKSEYENFQSFANSDRESFFNLINLFFVALGVLVTGATIVLYWLFGQSRQEVKKNAEEIINVSAGEVVTEAKQKFDEILGPTITDYDEKYRELNRLLDSGHKLKNSKFILACSDEERVNVETKLINRVRAISTTQIYDFNDFEEIKLNLSNKEIDMLIYIYKKEYEEEKGMFRQYINHLIAIDSKIPIIIYIDNGRIDGDEGVLLNQYPYSSLANIPTTLTTNIISMANLLSYEGGTENDC